MALIDRLQNSNLGLKGASPARIESSFKSSTTHAYDPKPGTQGDEDYRVKSDLDLNGKTPHKIPSAYRSSATHVYDPDFSTDPATDPLLSLTGKELKTAQRGRRSNNTLTFESALGIPPEGRLGDFTPSSPYDFLARNGRGGSNFELPDPGNSILNVNGPAAETDRFITRD